MAVREQRLVARLFPDSTIRILFSPYSAKEESGKIDFILVLCR